MDVGKYRDVLQKAYTLLEAGDIDEAEKTIEPLAVWRPMLLGFYVIQSMCRYRRSGKPVDFFGVLGGKYAFLYTYGDVMKTLEYYAAIFAEKKNFLDQRRNVFFLEALRDNFSRYDEISLKLADREENFEGEKEIFSFFFGVNDFLAASIQYLFVKRFYADQPMYERPWIFKASNMGYLTEEIADDDAVPFVVIATSQDRQVAQIIRRDLAALGKSCWFISCNDEGSQLLDARDEIVASDERVLPLLQLVRSKTAGGFINVIASRRVSRRLSEGKELCRQFQRIVFSGGSIFDRNMTLSWYGDYLSYISKIYLEDCYALVKRPSTKKFSIVIPARNSAVTLRHTLRTCLEQVYDGAYEIVVSDNSTGENTAVRDLCEELNDSRIVYLKTPRDLQLAKSFEYAFLHTSGEYVLSIGSDDGLLPWALETISYIAEAFPDEDIINWERGFYAWPGFNGGQAHQLVIPRRYDMQGEMVYYRASDDYFVHAAQIPMTMYDMPLLYLNSCFKRSYMKTLLEKTGRLWDGICQDLYMGVVNLCINDRILCVKYPLTIAGMSPSSIGFTSGRPMLSNQESTKKTAEVLRDNNIGGYSRMPIEEAIPDQGTDIHSFYTSLMRAIGLGILPQERFGRLFDWKQIFRDMMGTLYVTDVNFDRKYHETRYAAMQRGEDFLKWFDETYPIVFVKAEKPDEASGAPRRTYDTGVDQNGALTLDASEYGVENIYDAVQLFVKKMAESKGG